MVKILFWICAGIVLYVYFGYPLLLIILSKFIKKPVKKGNIEPSVTIIVAAYNEEKCIKQKLENCLSLNYPRDKLEVIVASNGSTDNTNNIVRDYLTQGIKLEVFKEPSKTNAQNLTVPRAKGEIIVFSDANAIYHKDALFQLMANFADPKVGVVCGRSILKSAETSSVDMKESLYLRYEYWIRKNQSKIGSCVTGSGEMLAIRKELYQKINENYMEDFMLPLLVLEKGYRVIFEPKAFSSEKTSGVASDIFRCKVRIITQDFTAFFSVIGRLIIHTPMVAVQLISHKLLRWLIPFFLIVLLYINIFLRGSFTYNLILTCQFSFYLIALVAHVLEKRDIKIGLLSIPYYFVLVNLASALGVSLSIFGTRLPSWEKYR